MSDKHGQPCSHIQHSLRIAPNGGVKPCCEFKGHLTEFAYIDDLKEFWQESRVLKSLQERDIAGEWDENCRSCRDKEGRQLISRKQKFNKRFAQIEAQPGKLQYLDITFGNTCNLQCVMCNSVYSSKWRRSEAEFAEQHPWFTAENSWFEKNEDWTMSYGQVDMLCDSMDDVAAVEILGGEPLYDKKFRYWLNQMEARDRLANLSMHIVTNFTMIDDEIAAQLMKPRRLDLTISIDGTGRYYEWIRGYSFAKIQDNIEKYIPRLIGRLEMNSTIWDPHLFLNCVVSCYNLGNLLDYYHWIHSIMERYSVRIKPVLLPVDGRHLSPHLSPDSDRFLATDIFEIKQLIQSASMYSSGIKKSCIQDLDNIAKLLHSDVIPDEGLLAKHQQWHQHCVRLRGWDIWSHA